MTSPMKPSISTGMMPPSYGGGYGISQNKFWKERPVASGKHGIYPGKGKWDYDLEDDEEEIDSLDLKISTKAFSSSTQIPSDTNTKPDHKSFGNIGSHNLVSHAQKNGNILKEYIREILKEASISGSSYVKKTLGNPYYKDNNDIGSGINRSKAIPTVRSIQIPNATASGVKDMNYLDDNIDNFEDFEDDITSFELWNDFNIDVNNLKKHDKGKISQL